MLPIGPILLTILAVLIYFGLAEQVLERLRLTDRQALLAVGAMLLGSMFDVDLLPGLTINLGGGLVPLVLAVYLTFTAGGPVESVRIIAAGLVTAGAVYLVGRWFPPGGPTELNLFLMDAQYLYGLTAGLVGCMAGRTRRSAFCAAVAGVIGADAAHFLAYAVAGARQDFVVNIGGGGFWNTTMVAGVLAVVLAEFISETRETVRS